MNFGPDVIPAPRVMAVEKFLRRFHYVPNDAPHEGSLVQLWAVAHGVDENGEETLLVAHSIIGDGDEAVDHLPMKKSAFEKLVPLSILGTIPDDVSALSDLQSGPVEAPLCTTSVDPRSASVLVSADEGFDLSQRWMAGRKPIRQTVGYLRRALPVVPDDFAGSYVKSLQYLDSKSLEGEEAIEIAAMCFAIATVIDAISEE